MEGGLTSPWHSNAVFLSIFIHLQKDIAHLLPNNVGVEFQLNIYNRTRDISDQKKKTTENGYICIIILKAGKEANNPCLTVYFLFSFRYTVSIKGIPFLFIFHITHFWIFVHFISTIH